MKPELLRCAVTAVDGRESANPALILACGEVSSDLGRHVTSLDSRILGDPVMSFLLFSRVLTSVVYLLLAGRRLFRFLGIIVRYPGGRSQGFFFIPFIIDRSKGFLVVIDFLKESSDNFRVL